MGNYLPKPKIWDAELWVDAQERHHHGACTSFFHRLFHKEMAERTSKEFEDGSFATIYLCKKCNGLRDAWVTIKL